MNINNPYLERVVTQIYPSEFQLKNATNSSDTKAAFFDVHLLISNCFVSSKIYDKRNDLDFDIVDSPVLDCDVPRTPIMMLAFLKLFGLQACLVIWLTSMLVTQTLTDKLLQQGYRYHKLRKAFL